MSRIEWTRLSGDDVEHVVAVLLCRHNPSAVMVRPGQGDGGLDVIVPVSDDEHDVYQVKKFAENLTSSQWRQVKKSFTRLLTTIDNGEITVRNWYVTMPLNPTPANLTNLRDLANDAPFTGEWRGLTFIEGLAATYPEVIDYYLRDGKDRLQHAVTNLTTLIKGVDEPPTGDGVVDPDTVWRVLAAAQQLLNTDPHFSYAIGISPIKPADADDEAAIFATHRYDPALNQWISIKVYERFAEALNVRPITLQVKFHAAPDTPLRDDLDQFHKYGRPFTAPHGTVDVEADLPGGLGGTLTRGAMAIKAVRNDAQVHQLRFALTDDTDDVIAEIRINITDQSRSPDQQGLWATGTDDGQTIRYESSARVDERTMNVNFKALPIPGRPPEEVAHGLRFLSLLPRAAGIAVAPPRGPIKKSMIEPWEERVFTGDEAASDEFKVLADLADALTVIQRHTTTQILMPDTDKIPMSDALELIRTGRLLDGPPLRDTRARRMTFDNPIEFPDGPFQILGTAELTFNWQDETTVLGTLYTYSQAVTATLHPEQPEDGAAYTLTPVEGSEWLQTTDPTYLPVAPPAQDVDAGK